MLRSSLCDYSDAYIHVKETITVTQVAPLASSDNAGKEVVFKNCWPFTDYKSGINNTPIDKAKEIDVAMSMYNV